MTAPDLLAGLLMGLAGSGHCLAMCGGLAASMGMNQSPARLLLYNMGRIFSYTIAGALIGGAVFSIAQFNQDILIWLRAVAGLVMILLALYILRIHQSLLWLEKAGSYLWTFIQPLTKKLDRNGHGGHIFAAGMVWGWLPCGLVYSALTVSALSGHPGSSAIVMLMFGVGTLPSMYLAGLFSRQLNQFLSSGGFRWIAALLLVIYGLATIFIAVKQLFGAMAH